MPADDNAADAVEFSETIDWSGEVDLTQTDEDVEETGQSHHLPLQQQAASDGGAVAAGAAAASGASDAVPGPAAAEVAAAAAAGLPGCLAASSRAQPQPAATAGGVGQTGVQHFRAGGRRRLLQNATVDSPPPEGAARPLKAQSVNVHAIRSWIGKVDQAAVSKNGWRPPRLLGQQPN